MKTFKKKFIPANIKKDKQCFFCFSNKGLENYKKKQQRIFVVESPCEK